MSSIREKFVEQFGEDQAMAIEKAARMHRDQDLMGGDFGSDSFRWALVVCIGFQCTEVDRYRSHHGITAPWVEVKQWIKDHADLGSHDGDIDHLSLLAGVYTEYMPEDACGLAN